jgi:hypothetical protein
MNNFLSDAGQITAANNELMTKMIPSFGDYNEQMMKSGGFYPQNFPNIMNAGKMVDGTSNYSHSKSGHNGFENPNIYRNIHTSDSTNRRQIATYTGPVAGNPMQTSHLGVYRHDASLSLLKPNNL